MATVTYCGVLPFIRETDTGELVAEGAQETPSAQSAMRRGRAMIGHKAGAVTFSRTGDPKHGDFDNAVILGRYGETPPDLTSFTSMA